jgi:hypothetical protein
MAKRYPALHEYLTASRDPEGKVRQTCSLAIYGHLGRFKAFLNDRDCGAAIGVESDSVAGLLGALEAELESDAPSWFWRQGQGENGGKKKGR